ncbi:hypothetical protein FXF61_10000 [Pseudomonas sp. C27(2019)]|uniref:hypothetical protein n=1 Tax=Pseudomonas sp. C27(2019) TaxID=2604941 RepID=UPI001245B3EE|nr:hypothetical protein [Pseudomonas sp. C27(2019)]QEY59470.1 hypothetical protein FXF61_10000 [Pseudomonas sp. C27(2019)]
MLQRAGVVLPLTRLPGVMRALRHPWLRLPQHPHTAIDHWCCFQVCSMALLKHDLCMLQRAGVVLPLTRLPGVMRALRHPWLRSTQHPHTAIDHRCCFLVF